MGPKFTRGPTAPRAAERCCALAWEGGQRFSHRTHITHKCQACSHMSKAVAMLTRPQAFPEASDLLLPQQLRCDGARVRSMSDQLQSVREAMNCELNFYKVLLKLWRVILSLILPTTG